MIIRSDAGIQGGKVEVVETCDRKGRRDAVRMLYTILPGKRWGRKWKTRCKMYVRDIYENSRVWNGEETGFVN